MRDHLLATAVDSASPPVVFLQAVALVGVRIVAVEADLRVVLFDSVQVVIRALDSAVVRAACLGAAVVRAAFVHAAVVQAPGDQAPAGQVDVVQPKGIQHSPRWAEDNPTSVSLPNKLQLPKPTQRSQSPLSRTM